MTWTLENWNYLYLLLLLPLFWIILTRYKRWRKKRQQQFAAEKFQSQLFRPESKYFYFLRLFYIVAIGLLVLSMADILTGGKPMKMKRQGTNLVFLLDLSNSMNAEDILPSRLDREKSLVLNILNQTQGNKIGMAIFASEAFSVLPLTTDYNAVETYVAGLETSTIKRQGTDFLMAMQEAAAIYQNTPPNARNVVLITDGEDNEGHAAEAINLAKKYKLKVITVGIGTEGGAPVPDYRFGQMMGYKMNRYGDVVVSKRETKALQNIASATGGRYIDGNSTDAEQQIANTLTNLESSSEIEVTSEGATHYYQWFLGGALLIFFIIYLTNPRNDFNI